jgi:malate synthase
VRGDKVIAFARAFLDEAAPLAAGSHVDSTGYTIVDGKLVVALKGGSNTGLRDDAQLIGFQGDAAPTAILLKTTACTSKSRSTPAPRSARPTPPASKTS